MINPNPIIAFTNTTITKPEIIAQLEAHALADEIVKGQYWENGKGCAVGCTIHGRDHAEYETLFGIPQALAHLKDVIFEGLPNDQAKQWPLRFINAVEPGSDLSRVQWHFLHWLLTDEKVNPGINHPSVRSVVKHCADILVPLTKGLPVDVDTEAVLAVLAEEAAQAAAATWAAKRASAAAQAAASAADLAKQAWATWAAKSSAARVGETSAEAAWTAAGAAESSYILMANKLIVLIHLSDTVN